MGNWQDETTLINDPTQPFKWDPSASPPGPGEEEEAGPPVDLGGLDELMTPEGSALYTTGEHHKAAARHGVPMATTAAGGILGGMVGAPTLGAMAGGYVGEQLVQGAGLAEQDELNVALAALAPGLGPAAGKVARGSTRLMGRLVPGATTWLHESAVATLRGFQASMEASLGSVDDAWRAITAGPAGKKSVPIGGVIKRMREVIDDELVLKEYGAAAPVLVKRLQGFIKGFEGFDEIPLKHLDLYRRRIGAWLGKAAREGGEEYGAYSQVYRSVMEAAETVAEPAFKKALQISKIEHGLMDFGSVVTTKGIQSLADGTVALMPKAIFQQLRINKPMTDMLGPARVRLIDTFMKGLIKHVPAVNTAPGMLVASRLTGQLGAMLAGGALGYGAGGAAGAAKLAQTGAGVMGALAGPGILRTLGDSVARLVLSDPGRGVLKMIYQEAGGKITPPVAVALMQAARSLTADAFLNQPVLPKGTTTADKKPQTKNELEKIFFPEGA